MTLLEALNKGQYLTFLKLLLSGGFFTTNSNGGDAANVVVSDRPVYAQNQQIVGKADVAASATDNVQIYISGDLTGYSEHSFENLSATDPIDVYGSLDGTNFNATPVMVEIVSTAQTAGKITVNQIAVGEICRIIGKWKALKVLRKGTTNEAQSIRYLHGVL